MKTTIQARLDPESQQLLRRLMRQLGWNPSRIVREGLRLLGSCHGGKRRQKIVGVGKFSSGIRDLGSSKKHLEGFGR